MFHHTPPSLLRQRKKNCGGRRIPLLYALSTLSAAQALPANGLLPLMSSASKHLPRMELLAPAGGFPAFEAALEAGADAVYVGAPGFNARALSRDFTFAEIGSMIRQAHGAGKRVYIAMNSLVKEAELPAALEALSCFESLRPDALIVQDIGLLQLALAHFPSLPLHASTLLSVHNSLAAAELTTLGCSRVVLAREMTIEEIAAVHRSTTAELEVFVHGAMCFSYSGLCLFSSLHGGKSSLRGQCVQPCRRRYDWQPSGRTEKGKDAPSQSGGYLFSMNDLCGIDLLPALRKAGVRCLKIEGRLKSGHYVGSTVAAYRMAIDSLDQPEDLRQEILRRAHSLLDDAMGRTRSSGYLLSSKPTEAVSPEQSGNSGLLLGRIKGIKQERQSDGKTRLSLQTTLTAQVREGDRLRLHDELNGERVSFTLRTLIVQNRKQKVGQTGQRAQISLFIDQPGRFDRNFQGSLFRVDVEARIAAEKSSRERSKELAGKRVPPNRSKVEQILAQMAWKAETEQAGAAGKRPHFSSGRRVEGRSELPCWIMLSSVADLRERLPVLPQRILLPLHRDNLRQLDQQAAVLRQAQPKIIWQLPPILHEAELAWMREQVLRLRAAGWHRFALGHCSQTGLFAQQQGLELHGHYTLNLLNSASLHAVLPLGLRGTLFSVESEAANIAAALSHFRRRQRGSRSAAMQIGIYAYGRPPLFTSRLDGAHFRWQQLAVSPKEERFSMERRDGLTLARAVQPFSLLHRRQELAALGIDFLFLDLSGGPVKKEAAALNTLLGQEDGRRGKRPEVLTGNFSGVLI
jgi:U32 family peptidase